MKNNNGKIAIAIVAMFVVALSIVGVTYAYFTATIEENTDTAKSVKVTAGSMEVDYTGGKTFTVQNILPGWINDGDKYYDIDASNVVIDSTTGKTGYVAASKAAVENEKPFGGSDTTAGLANPVTFSITNTGDNPAAYDVEMKVVANNVSTTGDLKYFVFASENEADLASNDPEALEAYRISSEEDGNVLPAASNTDLVEIQKGVKLVNNSDAMYYKILFVYINNTTLGADGEPVQNEQQGMSFSTEMVVTGLSQDAAK